MSNVLRVGGVWEEALLEELIYAIAHIAHAEQHLLEIETSQGKPVIPELINALRSCRKDIGDILFNNLQVAKSSTDPEFRGSAESFWCFLKHTSMALIHCDEIAEKLIKRLINGLGSSANEADMDKVKDIASNLIDVYRVRKMLRDTLMKVLKEPPTNIDSSSLVRCREDLCLDSDSE
ncbi:MAG: hypothetical protein RMH77_02335 [Sulfolobales archaeon]|nr:hypothetical protein [Sulfolobales archaeon]MCX8185970.1 hypothetical protein [Sulfolobales archaeon]MDW7969227.1 hypothetical protein [Sulfolobales archaeon]